jgi:hypothetical protein
VITTYLPWGRIASSGQRERMSFFGSSSLVVFTQIRGDRRAPVDTTAAMEQDWLGKPTEGSQGLAHIVVAWPLVVGARDARDFESAVAVVAEQAPGCRSGPPRT